MKRRQEAAEEADRQRLQAEAGETLKQSWMSQNINIFKIFQIKEQRNKQLLDKQKKLLEIKLMLELHLAKKLVGFLGKL